MYDTVLIVVVVCLSLFILSSIAARCHCNVGTVNGSSVLLSTLLTLRRQLLLTISTSDLTAAAAVVNDLAEELTLIVEFN